MKLPIEEIESLLEKAYRNKQKALAENQVYDIFKLLRCPVPAYVVLDIKKISSETVKNGLSKIPSDEVVLKISGSKTLHKTESGGVKICPKYKALQIIDKMKKEFKDIEGILICEYVPYTSFALGQELMLGARYDDAFGAIITLGVGGTDAENFTSVLKHGYCPHIASIEELKTDKDIKKFIDSAWIWKYTSGRVRGGRCLAHESKIFDWIKAFVFLMTNFAANSILRIDEVEINPLVVCAGNLVALDGVLRFGKPEVTKRILPTSRGIKSLLEPKTVAIAGVSETKMNMGRIILNNVVKEGWNKENLYIFKDYKSKINGIDCFASCRDFPKPVDMFVVVLPSDAVASVLQDAAVSGKVRGVVLISGGMGEKKGTETTKKQVEEIIRQAKENNPDFTLNGGNSLGIISNPSRVNTFFISPDKMTPPLGKNPDMANTAFISQSGAFLITALSKMPWFKPVYSVSVGNQMDVTVVDYLCEVCDDEKIKVVLGYIEGFKETDGTRLINAVKKAVGSGKKVVLYKAGRTVEGQKSVMGHTASIAGNYTVFESLLKKSGAYVAETFEEFEDYIQLCSFYADFKSKTGNIYLLSNAGFESAGMADNLGKNIKVPPPDAKLTTKLRNILKKYRLDGIVDVKNPFDVTPMASDDAIYELTETIYTGCEAMIVSPVPLTPVMKTLPKEGLNDSLPVKLGVLAKKYKKPIVFCISAGSLYDDYCQKALNSGLAVFRSSDRALNMLGKFMFNK